MVWKECRGLELGERSILFLGREGHITLLLIVGGGGCCTPELVVSVWRHLALR